MSGCESTNTGKRPRHIDGDARVRFTRKVCLVTGGTSGIGRATCARFGSEGAKVVIIGRNEQHGREVVAQIKEKGGDALFVPTDVSDSAEVQAAVSATVQQWKQIDVLVNNAAMMTFAPLIDLREDEWDKVMAVNLRSVFLFCKYCLPHMQGGAIVNVSSVHAHETTPDVTPYATSKAGMEGFTRALSRECEAAKVRVNNVAPGAVNTPMLWSNPNVKSGREKIEGAIGQPDDIAAAIAFLASDEARFINGTTLVVDGGRLQIL